MACCCIALKTLADCLNEFGLPASAEAVYQHFFEQLEAANRQVNLTRILGWESFLYKHIWDSLTLLTVLPQVPALHFLDLGSGGGVPGIPLWIARPNWSGILLDSVGKKMRAVSAMVDSLCQHFPDWFSTSMSVLNGRAEDVGQQAIYREQFDWVVARAVAPLPVLLELALPLVKPGGGVIAMKGPQVDTELGEGKAVAPLLGGTLREVRSLVLPDGSQRCLVIFDKKSPTPHKFPRKPGVPSHQPLKGQIR